MINIHVFGFRVVHLPVDKMSTTVLIYVVDDVDVVDVGYSDFQTFKLERININIVRSISYMYMYMYMPVLVVRPFIRILQY